MLNNYLHLYQPSLALVSVLSSPAKEALEREKKAWAAEFNSILERKFSKEVATRHQHHTLWSKTEGSYETETKSALAHAKKLAASVSYSGCDARQYCTWAIW